MAYKSGGGQKDRRIVNMAEYCRLRAVRLQTSLIGGRIFYDGRYWDKDEYNAAVQIDGRQIEK